MTFLRQVVVPYRVHFTIRLADPPNIGVHPTTLVGISLKKVYTSCIPLKGRMYDTRN
jgi:hypothetical protein